MRRRTGGQANCKQVERFFCIYTNKIKGVCVVIIFMSKLARTLGGQLPKMSQIRNSCTRENASTVCTSNMIHCRRDCTTLVQLLESGTPHPVWQEYVALTTAAYRQAIDQAWDATTTVWEETPAAELLAQPQTARTALAQLFARGQDSYQLSKLVKATLACMKQREANEKYIIKETKVHSLTRCEDEEFRFII